MPRRLHRGGRPLREAARPAYPPLPAHRHRSHLPWAHADPRTLALTFFYAAVERKSSPLEPALRSLRQIRVSQLTHCAFCMDINAALAAERSGSMAKALAVADWRNSTRFSAREAAALQYSEEITSGEVNGETSARISQLFGENGLVELTGLIAFQNMSARFNAALSPIFIFEKPGKSTRENCRGPKLNVDIEGHRSLRDMVSGGAQSIRNAVAHIPHIILYGIRSKRSHITLTRCRTVDLVLLCDLVDCPMLTDLRRERCLRDGK